MAAPIATPLERALLDHVVTSASIRGRRRCEHWGNKCAQEGADHGFDRVHQPWPPPAPGDRRLGRGIYTPLREVPGAAITAHLGINNYAQITGTQHAFLQDPGRTQTLDAPGGNIASGINDRGQIILPDPRAARLLPVAT